MKLSLDGAWRGEGFAPDGRRIAFEGRVPGCVHADLLRNGTLKELFWRNNAEESQWVEKWNWAYEREFDAPEAWEDAEIEFGGLDTCCRVFLNGFSCSKGIRTTCSATSHSGFGSALAFSSISCAFVSCDRGEARASWDIACSFAVSLVEAAMSLIPANLHHLPKMTEATALCAAAQVKPLFCFVSRYKKRMRRN